MLPLTVTMLLRMQETTPTVKSSLLEMSSLPWNSYQTSFATMRFWGLISRLITWVPHSFSTLAMGETSEQLPKTPSLRIETSLPCLNFFKQNLCAVEVWDHHFSVIIQTDFIKVYVELVSTRIWACSVAYLLRYMGARSDVTYLWVFIEVSTVHVINLLEYMKHCRIFIEVHRLCSTSMTELQLFGYKTLAI